MTNTVVDNNVSTMASAIQIFGDSSVECTGGSSITNNASGTTFGAVSLSEVSSVFTSDACDMGSSSSSTENTPFDILTFNGIILGNYTMMVFKLSSAQGMAVLKCPVLMG